MTTSILRGREAKWPSPDPQPLAEDYQEEDDPERRRNHCGLDSEADLGSLLFRPLHLKVGDDKAAQRARIVQVGADLAASLRVAIEAVAAHGDGGDHDSVDVETPGYRQGHEVPRVLQRLTNQYEAHDHEREREEDGSKPYLGLEVALVCFDVTLRQNIMQEVTGDLTEEHCDDWREVKVTDLQRAEVVQRREEDRKCSVDSHDPRKGKQVVNRRQQYCGLEDDFNDTHASLRKGVAQTPGAELRDAKQAGESTAQVRLICGWDASVVVRFIDQEHGEKQNGACLGRVHPEWSRPWFKGRHEGREKRAHVRAHDEERRPNVDLARTLVEEEHVLDEHHSSALCDGREEAVQDASAHKRLERNGSCTPRSRCKGHHEEVECHWETSKVRRQYNGCRIRSCE